MNTDLQYGKNTTGLFRLGERSSKVLFCTYALKNKVVIMGRGGNFLLKGIPYALRIRVTAPIERGLRGITRRDSADEKQQNGLLKNRQRKSGFYKLDIR